jgi:hypothetical protein
MPTVNLSGGKPYDVTAEQENILRRRKIAEALAGKGVGGDYSPVSGGGNIKVANWGDAIGQVAGAWAGKRQMDDLDKRSHELGAETNRRLQSGVQDYLTASQPHLGEAAGPPTEDGQMPQQMNPADPIKAISGLLGSGIGPLQQLGLAKAMQQDKAQNPLQSKDILAHLKDIATPESIVRFIQSGGDQSQLQFQRSVKEGAGGVYGDLTAAQSGQGPVKPVGYAGPTFNAPQPGAGGMPPTQTQIESGQAHGLTGGNVTPAIKREELGAGADMKQLEAGKKEATDAVGALQAVATAQDLVRQIPDQALGSLSDLRLFVNKGIQALGGKPLAEGSNVEQLKGALGNIMLEKIRALAPVTTEDVKIMQNILGSNTNTKEALGQMLNYAEQKYTRSISTHNNFVGSLAKEQGIGPDFANRWRVDFKVGGVPLAGAQNLPQGNQVLKFDANGNPIQ